MMNNLVIVLSAFALLKLATCRPSAPTHGAFTKDSKVELPGSERIGKRSVATNEDIDEAIAYRFHPLPVFRKRSVNKMENSRSIDNTQETHRRLLRSLNTDDASEEDMKMAGNGLVFLPLFRPRRSSDDTVKAEVLSNVADTDDDLEAAETIIFRPVFRSQLRPARSVQENEDLQGDDMAVAENGLIFRPLFRTKQGGTLELLNINSINN